MNAEQTQITPRNRTEFVLGLVFFVCSILFLLYLIAEVRNWVRDQQSAPISQVRLYGKFQQLDVNSLQQRLHQEYVGNFFRVDVDQVQQFLQQQPWVYQSAVRKLWPDTLVVVVTEQQPVAIWNGEQLLNEKGQVFAAPIQQLNQPLPWLYGPDGTEQDALNMFGRMQQLMALHQFDVQKVYLTERFAWRLELADGLSLQLGREDTLKRLQRFIELYPTMQQHQAGMAEVDLRYDTGIAVRYAVTDTKRKT